MEVNIRQKDGTIILQPSGKLIGMAAVELRKVIKKQLTNVSGVPKLLIDFADVSIMGSSGLGALMAIRRAIASRGGRMALLNASHAVVNLMILSRLFSIFEHFSRENEAIAALAANRNGRTPEFDSNEAALKRELKGFEDGFFDARSTIDPVAYQINGRSICVEKRLQSR